MCSSLFNFPGARGGRPRQHRLNLFLAVAQLRQNSLGLLPLVGAPVILRQGRVREQHRGPHQGALVSVAVLHLVEAVRRPRLLVLQQLIPGLGHGVGDVGGFKRRAPLGQRLFCHFADQQIVELVKIGLQIGLWEKPGIARQILPAQGLDKPVVQRVVGRGGKLDPPAIAGFVGHSERVCDVLPGHGVASGRLAVLGALQHGGHRPDGGVEQAYRHHVALAGFFRPVQCRQQAGGQIHSHRVVAEPRHGEHGGGILVKQGAQDAAPGKISGEIKPRQVLVRALFAVAGDVAHHQLGVLGLQRLPVQAGLDEGLVAHVGEKDVRPGNELFQRLPPLGGLGVQTDVTFVGVVQVEAGVFQIAGGTAFVDSGIAVGVAAGGLHLHHLRAQVGQIAAAGRRGDECGKLHDFDAREGAGELVHN